MDDNSLKQKDELEVLSSVYGDQWKREDFFSENFSIEISEGELLVILYISLPLEYPSMAPPIYQLSAPKLSRQDKIDIGNQLETIYLDNIGDSIIYHWIECIRTYLQQKSDQENNTLSNHIEDLDNLSLLENKPLADAENLPVPEITHGEIIVDRKSIFQGHVAVVTSMQEIKSVLHALKDNKKIANATHNIYAYRIKKDENGTVCFMQDCEDDGETNAGSRLLHLLQIMDVCNVLVIVSRWYGGIHLGPDRFRHINNAARNTLTTAGFNSKKK